MTHLKKHLPLMIIILLSASAWYFGLYHYFSFEAFKVHQKSLQLFIEQNQLLAILSYCGLYILVVSLSIPVATFMTLAGGFLFGQWVGALATVVSATIGASILFLSAKMASADLLSKKAGPWIKKMQSGFQENAFFYLLTLRLIPLFPFVAINLASAFFQIQLRTFFFGTLFGIIPGSFVYTSMGVAFQDIVQMQNFSPNVVLNTKLLLAFMGLGVLSLLPVLYKKFKGKS